MEKPHSEQIAQPSGQQLNDLGASSAETGADEADSVKGGSEEQDRANKIKVFLSTGNPSLD